MTPGEIGAMLTNLNNIQLKLEAASGVAVAVEMRMRLIGQLCEPVRDKLKELVNAYKASNKLKKTPSNNYWDCELSFLDQAIDEIFHDKLEPNEQQKIAGFSSFEKQASPCRLHKPNEAHGHRPNGPTNSFYRRKKKYFRQRRYKRGGP